MAQQRSWSEVLNDQAAAREDREPRRSIAINLPNDLYSLIAEAARRRDMSYTAYVRRAALAFAQADIGFDWEEMMAEEPGIVPSAEVRPGLSRGVASAGHDFGAWKIVDLEPHFPEDTA